MIVRNGLTAIKRIPPRQKFIHLSNGNEYVFAVKNNISMSWIKNEDVDTVLDLRGGGCCGGTKHQVFHYALEHDVRRYEYGGR